MAEEAGQIWLGRGKDAQHISWIASVDYDQLNNAAGTTGTYINGKEMALGSGQGYPWEVPSQYSNGAHRGPGELLYVGIAAEAVDQMDTSAFSTFALKERRVDASGANPKADYTHALGDRVTSVPSGGFADDPNTVVGQIVPILAFPALPPGVFGKLFGFARLTTADQ